MSDRNFEFLGFFERCDGIVSFWTRFQASLIFIFYLAIWPFSFLGKSLISNLGLYFWLVHALIVTIIALIGFLRLKSLSRTFSRAVKLISKHSNKKLVVTFKRAPRIIRTIMVLEIFLVFTWIVSFPLKLLFYKNINSIKKLIMDYKNLD